MATATIIFRLLLSVFLGFILGMERDRVHKEAGIRTLSLVGLGTTLFTMLSVYGLQNSGMDYEPTRIASNIVTGIGFLGAGIIFHKGKVHNMTTAATIWIVAAIGMAVGMGWYLPAVTVTAIVLFVLIVVRVFSLEEKIGTKEDKE